MTTELERPATVSPVEAATTSLSTTKVGGELWITKFHRFFADISKYVFFAVFVFYSIGFIIWHSYLGSYGVSTLIFLQAEYLAAAFCYIFILTTFSVPPILILKTILENIKSKGVRGIKQWDRNWAAVLLIWFYLSTKTTTIFFPNNSPIGTHIYFWLIYGGIVAFHLSSIILFYITVGFKTHYFRQVLFGKKPNEQSSPYNWKATKFYKYAVNREYYYLYILTILMANFFLNPQIDSSFLFSCLFFYFSVMACVSNDLVETWNQSGTVLRSIIVATICLLFISNIQLFAIS